jgi:hypothetical protein
VTRPDPSPLHRSETGAFQLIGGLVALLALVTAAGAVLIFTIDDAQNSAGRGLGMLGISSVCGALSALLFWLAKRPASTPSARAVDLTRPPPAEGWSRGRLGSAWHDWLAPLLPLVLIALPILLLREAPLDLEALVGLGLVVGFFELIVISVTLVSRREHVRVQLAPEGLLITRRSGSAELVARGQLREVRLETRTVRGFSFGTLELHRTSGPPITFREPMSAPLAEIAHACAAHMQAPLSATGPPSAG